MVNEVEPTWKTKDNRELKMSDMSVEHLQAAFHHTTLRELSFFNKMNTMVELKEQLLQEAANRGIKLLYPDERYPSPKWGNYFANDRKAR